MYKDIANLLFVTRGYDSEGFEKEVETKIEVFVNKQSVKRSEFYTAMQSGVTPTIAFELRIEDWELSRTIVDGKAKYAEHIEYDGAKYRIVRAFEKDNSIVELTCE